MKIKSLLKKLNITTDNISLYYEAMTHKTYTNENKTEKSYQRLEFFGDSILDFLSAEYLYNDKNNWEEGKMSIVRANAVNKTALANFSRELKLNEIIRTGNTKENFNNKDKVMSDLFESLLAAIYIDQGKKKAIEFLKGNVLKIIDDSKDKDVKNPKTILQEYLQLESRGTIEYKTKMINNIFVSEVFHEDAKFGVGKGKSKKEAEVNAAKEALKIVGGV